MTTTALAQGDPWEDLGDDELLARLVQRGMEPGIARRLVVMRETGQAARAIAQRLASRKESA